MWDVLQQDLAQIPSVLAYAVIGTAICGALFYVVVMVSPLSVRKQVEEVQNPAVGILIGAALIFVALLVAAAIRST